MRRILTVIFVFALISPAKGGELLAYHVKEIDGHFLLHLDMRIDADYEAIRAVLLDFARMPQVNDTVLESRLLEAHDDKYKILFVSKGCIWIFCQTIRQVALVTELNRNSIMSSIIAEQSDLRYGRSLWRLIDEKNATRVIYDADYVPDFWVPPLIGSAIAKNKMLEEGRKTINGLERVVNSQGPADK